MSRRLDNPCCSSISDDSQLKSDSDDEEVERQEEKKARRRRRFRIALLAVRYSQKFRSKKKWSLPRLIWPEYVEELIHQNEFDLTFRMSFLSFCKLVELLRVKLTVDDRQGNRSSEGSGCIMPELVVAMTLRWLAGGVWQDIKKVYGISGSHFYFLSLKFLDAILDCPELEIRLPDNTDIEALELLASQFEAQASQSVFRGCVGTLDGLTVLIKAPTAVEAENVLA